MKKLTGMVMVACLGMAVAMGAAAQGKNQRQSDDVPGASKRQYNCELGKKVTVYHKADEQDIITLRWNNKNHELKREATTTGAHRFEDKRAGLVWINIPAKSMLLDSKKGRQLANECKS